LAYTEAKRRSRHPEKFGTGHPEGIAAPEAANNAAVGGALIPLITLGIPGSPTAAIILSALVIQGIQPGPQVFEKMPELVYGLFAGLVVATAMMYLIGLFTTNLWARAVTLPNWLLAPVILVLSTIGAYINRNLLFDIWLTLIFGIVGYFLRKFNYSLPSLILGFVLGFLTEANLRRSLLLSNGSYLIFVTRPISLILLLLAAVSLVGAILQQRRQKGKLD
ncbi:MAG: putative tricarboxylic transport rane protein, partial [Clostridia bacterium]|nr:putative tricarboxylic transport rane protein [Clostridia bacterium]